MIKKRGIVFLIYIVLLLSFSFISAGTLRVTEEHPFLINDEWISASQLEVGDELTTIDGKKVRITNLEDIEESSPFLVYNLEANEYSNFVVDGGEGLGVIVHNSNKLNEIPIHFYDAHTRDHILSVRNAAKIIGQWRYIYGKLSLAQMRRLISNSNIHDVSKTLLRWQELNSELYAAELKLKSLKYNSPEWIQMNKEVRLPLLDKLNREIHYVEVYGDFTHHSPWLAPLEEREIKVIEFWIDGVDAATSGRIIDPKLGRRKTVQEAIDYFDKDPFRQKVRQDLIEALGGDEAKYNSIISDVKRYFQEVKRRP